MITLTIGLKTIPDLLDTNSTHTDGYRIFLHHRTGGGGHICKLGWKEWVGLPFPSRRSVRWVVEEYHMAWVKWIAWNAFSEI